MSGVKGKSGIYKRTEAHKAALKGKVPWNKGLSKDDDPRVRKYIEKSARVRKGKTWNELYGMEGAKKKREQRKKLSG